MLALIALIYEAGNVVVNQCKIVKQCPAEAARIAIRTQNVLGLLQAAAEEFQGNVALETSLLELRSVLQRVIKLVDRCKQKARFSAKVMQFERCARHVFFSNDNREGPPDGNMCLELVC